MAISTVQSNLWSEAGSLLRMASLSSFSRGRAPVLIAAVLSGALGFLFAVIAARSYPSSTLGVAAAGTVTLVWLATSAQLGLGRELARILPRAGTDRPRLAATPAILVGVVALVLVGIFVAGIGVWAPGLDGLRQSIVTTVLVVFLGVTLALSPLGEGILAGLGLGRRVAAVRIGVGVVRLVLLGGASGLSGWLGDFGPLVAWTIPPLLVVVGIGLFAWRWFLTDPGDDIETELAVSRLRSADRSLQAMVAHARAGWALEATAPAQVALVTLIVLSHLGGASVALGLAAGVAVYCLYRMTGAMSEVLASAPQRDQASRERQLLRHAVFTSAVAAPVVVAAVIVAPWLMGLFGSGYADGATGLFRISSLAVIPLGVVQLYTARVRRRNRFDIAVGVEGAVAVATVLLSWILVRPLGLVGVGVAWLVVILGAAAYVVIVESLWWWGPRLSGGPARMAAALARLGPRWRELRTSRAMNEQVGSHLEALYPTHPSWRRVGWDDDRQSIAVAGHDGRPPLRLELARSKLGSELLAKRVTAVRELNEVTGLLSLRSLIPYPIDHSRATPITYLVESAISGHPGDQPNQVASREERLEAVIAAVSELHQATADFVVIDSDGLDRWIARPLRTLGDGCQVDDDQLMMLGRMLRRGFEAPALPWGRIHGRLRLDATRFDANGRLIGIQGWEWSRPGPIAVDWGSLTLSAIIDERGEDLGPVVCRLLQRPSGLVEHQAYPLALPADLDPTALVLFCWLHYLLPELTAAAQHGASRYWVARNVQPVMSALARHSTVSV